MIGRLQRVGSATAPFDPVRYFSAADLSYDFTAEASRVTRSGAMNSVLGYGSSPPAITLAGTPAATVIAITIEVTTTGTASTAVFRWSSDNKVTWTSGVTGSSLSGSAMGSTGITPTLPAGTYTCDTTTPTNSHWWEALKSR